MKRTLLALVLLGASVSAGAVDSVKEFRGSGNLTTAIFTVESPWLLDWRLDGDYVRSGALEITLVEAYTGRLVGRVLNTKRIGKDPRNGLQLFDHGGSYQLRISSSLSNWTIKIQQIEPEDAELYTPRNVEKYSRPPTIN